MCNHLAVAPKEAAGAPKDEITVTAEMIEQMTAEFFDWWAENNHLLDCGLPGDLLALRLRLNTAFANASSSLLSTPNEL
jgi:hypothetical protein